MIKKYSKRDAEMYLGANIKHYRKLKGLTQSDLSEKMGVNRKLISDYERGTLLPSLLRAKEIADLLDVPLDDLLKPNDYQ